MLDLDAIEARAEAATPGPWRQTTSKRGYRDVLQTPDSYGDRMIAKIDQEAFIVSRRDARMLRCPNADADFIAHARIDIPALVAELRAAREVVEAAQEEDHWRAELPRLRSCADLEDGWAEWHAQYVEAEIQFYCANQAKAAALAAYRAVVGEA
jgi:hypothetical protein